MTPTDTQKIINGSACVSVYMSMCECVKVTKGEKKRKERKKRKEKKKGKEK